MISKILKYILVGVVIFVAVLAYMHLPDRSIAEISHVQPRGGGTPGGSNPFVKIRTTLDAYTPPVAGEVFYSVGQSSADMKTGSPTLTLSSGIGTFSEAQTGNIGVGDAVTYNTNVVAYISGKISTSQWRMTTATGGTPADITNSTVVSIARAFTSLNAAEGQSTNASHLTSGDLVTNNKILNLALYYDTGADTSNVVINGYTTGRGNYIRIYTPYDTVNEVNQSQRHSGVWDTSKWHMSITDAITINIQEDYVRLDGLQIQNVSPAANSRHVIDTDTALTPGSNEIWISNSIIRGHGNASFSQVGIDINSPNIVAKIWNVIGYGLETTNSNNFWINVASTVNTLGYIYNSTFIGGFRGLNVTSVNGRIFCQNSYFGGTGSEDYRNTGGGLNSIACASEDTTASGTTYDSIAINTTNFVNVTSGSEDFHLASGSALKNVGVAVSDITPPLNFSKDIDLQTRAGGTWDIGADEQGAPNYAVPGVKFR